MFLYPDWKIPVIFNINELILQLSVGQVVYQVANEGSRLDIPEGPLGRLIAGTGNSLYYYLH